MKKQIIDTKQGWTVKEGKTVTFTMKTLTKAKEFKYAPFAYSRGWMTPICSTFPTLMRVFPFIDLPLEAQKEVMEVIKKYIPDYFFDEKGVFAVRYTDGSFGRAARSVACTVITKEEK